MGKVLSIENIKKEIIDKLTDNADILECLDIVKEFDDDEYKAMNIISPVKQCIFDNDIFNFHHSKGSYIAVDAEEHELITRDWVYDVIIKTKIDGAENMSKVSSKIKDIILELYPDRTLYSNIPLKPKTENYGYDTYHRMITFKIKKYKEDSDCSNELKNTKEKSGLFKNIKI